MYTIINKRNIEKMCTMLLLVLWCWSYDNYFLGILSTSFVFFSFFISLKDSKTVDIISRLGTILLFIITGFLYLTNKIKFGSNIPLEFFYLGPILILPRVFTYLCIDKGPNKVGFNDGVSVIQNDLFNKTQIDAGFGIFNKISSLNIYNLYVFICVLLLLPASKSIIIGVIGFFIVFICAAKEKIKNIKYLSSLVVLFFITSVVGGALGYGVNFLQDKLEDYIYEWIKNKKDLSGSWSAEKAETSIGKLGDLRKNGLNNKLVWRYESNTGETLLRRGVYSSTHNGTSWSVGNKNKQSGTEAVIDLTHGVGIDLINYSNNKKVENKRSFLYGNLKKEKTVIPLPNGTQKVYANNSGQGFINYFNALSLAGIDGNVKIGLIYSDSENLPLPSSEDLDVPKFLKNSINSFLVGANIAPTIEELKHVKNIDNTAEKIANHFSNNWYYTLNLNSKNGVPRTLSNFLTKEKEGHCEYFASSTVLILRSLGIPARYATGFVVKDYSEAEGLYWLRQKHSHAWALYWNGLNWVTIDSTPSQALSEMDSDYSLDAQIIDFFQKMQFKILKINGSNIFSAEIVKNVIFLLVSLIVIMVLLFFYKKSNKKEKMVEELTEILNKIIEEKSGLTKKAQEDGPLFWKRVVDNIKDLELKKELLLLSELRNDELYQNKNNNTKCLIEKLITKIKKIKKNNNNL